MRKTEGLQNCSSEKSIGCELDLKQEKFYKTAVPYYIDPKINIWACLFGLKWFLAPVSLVKESHPSDLLIDRRLVGAVIWNSPILLNPKLFRLALVLGRNKTVHFP